ncbi:MAG TPA: hypothetical protein PKD95_01305 [Candidatus Paceibacterota bacterium]|nr:hypothetical protein [Candidatus Paceibacterota bacterium]
MIINAEGNDLVLADVPAKVYPDYKVHAIGANEDSHVHIDNDGSPIIYTSYMGYRILVFHGMNRCDEDLGDRIEVRKYVGGMYYYYTYHISKKQGVQSLISISRLA